MANKITCICGCNISKSYLNKHFRTKKHEEKMKNTKPTSTIFFNKEEIRKMMIELDDKIDEISEWEYLNECKRLKNLYDNNGINCEGYRFYKYIWINNTVIYLFIDNENRLIMK